ncbi:hypothetical protein NMY22_g12998 [Coprinellus aureogranulatus]|nr:hypothetical protein NMY22_g12998 [Coprinellus aureogranulatus]
MTGEYAAILGIVSSIPRSEASRVSSPAFFDDFVLHGAAPANVLHCVSSSRFCLSVGEGVWIYHRTRVDPGDVSSGERVSKSTSLDCLALSLTSTPTLLQLQQEPILQNILPAFNLGFSVVFSVPRYVLP